MRLSLYVCMYACIWRDRLGSSWGERGWASKGGGRVGTEDKKVVGETRRRQGGQRKEGWVTSGGSGPRGAGQIR